MGENQKPEVARCDWRDFINVEDEADAPVQVKRVTDALDEHFRHYCPPSADCPKCGKEHHGGDSAFIMNVTDPTFEWDLVHGEGRCPKCKWPMTGHHFIKDDDGQELCALRYFPLHAHPDFVTTREPADA